MRPKTRAYSHQGHGPRADQEAGYISATSAIHAQTNLRSAAGPYIGVKLRPLVPTASRTVAALKRTYDPRRKSIAKGNDGGGVNMQAAQAFRHQRGEAIAPDP